MIHRAIDQYLRLLAVYLKPERDEAELRHTRASLLQAVLVRNFPCVLSVRSFGSLVRQTGLSEWVNKKADVDIMLSLDRETFLRSSDGAILQQIASFLSEHCDCSDVSLSGACISVRFQRSWFDLFPVWHSEPSSPSYLFCDNLSRWHEGQGESNRDRRFNLGYSGVAEPNSRGSGLRSMVALTDPFSIDYGLMEYQERYGDLPRILILLLKYWRLAAPRADKDTPIPWSFIVERGVLHALEDETRFESRHGLVDFLAQLLANEDLYPRAMAEVPGFLELASSMGWLSGEQAQSEPAHAFEVLVRFFPVPQAPTELRKEARLAEFVQAQMMRATLFGVLGRDATAFDIIDSTYNEFASSEDEDVQEIIAIALKDKGRHLERLGRHGEAACAYRTVAMTCVRSEHEALVRVAMEALLLEIQLHQNQGDVLGERDTYAFIRAAFAGREDDEDVAEFLKAILRD